MIFTVKFVVLCCVYCKLLRDFGFFCSVNHFSEGGVKANLNVMSSPSLADNDSRLLKNSEGNCDGEWIFCWRKEADVALFLQVARIRKIRKNCEANLSSQLLLKTGRSQSNESWNTKQTNGSKSTNHKSWPFELVQVNMCFLRGLLRWLTEQKNPKFLWSLQNQHRYTTNFAISILYSHNCMFVRGLKILIYSCAYCC